MTTIAKKGSHPHIVFLVRSFGFPEGNAATNRVRLLGRALRECGATVSVLCMRVSERPERLLNRAARGECDGIGFLYAPGTTVRSASFLVRRYREVRGYVVSVVHLWRLRRRDALDCVYLAAIPETWNISLWIALRVVASMGVPVVVELNELPSTIKGPAGLFPGRFSHLDNASGAVVISGWLSDWVAAESRRRRHPVKIIEVPIVVDVHEQVVTPYPSGSPMVLYAASTGYFLSLTHVFEAMKEVWQRHPECRLTVTGMLPSRAAELAASAGVRNALEEGRIVLTGHLERSELLQRYREAWALLVPLFDDLRSRARFPTKIGEYLAAARPIVASGVGEIGRHFTDGEDAFIAPPDDTGAQSLARKICEVIENPERAARVGGAGRRLAERRFQYTEHGQRLFKFIESLQQGRQRGTI